MLDLTNLSIYFCNLQKMSTDAAQFVWNAGAVGWCGDLAEELKRMLELMEKGGDKEIALEYFCREMLAEISPDNAAYYISPVCSQDSSIRGHAWFAYSALRAVELAYKPAGVTQAALTVCAALGVACKKTLAMLNAEPAKALLPSPAFGSDRHPGQLLLAKTRPEERRAALHIVR